MTCEVVVRSSKFQAWLTKTRARNEASRGRPELNHLRRTSRSLGRPGMGDVWNPGDLKLSVRSPLDLSRICLMPVAVAWLS